MSGRHRESDHYGAHKPSSAEQVAGTPMFDAPPAPPAWTQKWASLSEAERAAQRERWKDQLLPVIRELASRRGPEGITASEVIGEGIVRGLLNGERAFLKLHPRIYSWIGAFLSQLARDGELRAKTVRLENGGEVHVRRESTREASHHNAGLVYVRAA